MSLEEIQRAATVAVRAPHEIHLPTDVGSEALPELRLPTYDQATAPIGSDVRAQLNDASKGLGAAIATKEEDLTQDTAQQDDMSGCLKAALWDIAFDAAWDEANNNAIDVGAELDKARENLINCFGQRLRVGPVAATSLTNYFAESIFSRGAEALQANPTATAFVEWAAVTAWYSIR